MELQVVLEYFLYPKIRYGFHSHVWSLSVAARSFKDGGGRGILMQQKPEKSIKYYLILSQHKIHGQIKEKDSITGLMSKVFSLVQIFNKAKKRHLCL